MLIRQLLPVLTVPRPFLRALTCLRYGDGMVLPALVSRASRSRSHWTVRVSQVANYGRSNLTADSVGRYETDDRTQAPLRERRNQGSSRRESQVHGLVLSCDCHQCGLCRHWHFSRMETAKINRLGIYFRDPACRTSALCTRLSGKPH